MNAHFPITSAALDNLPVWSLRPTQGQWWNSDFWVHGTERRVSLTASNHGYFLWTAELRRRSGSLMERRYFVSHPGSDEPVAVFRRMEDRDFWLRENSKA